MDPVSQWPPVSPTYSYIQQIGGKLKTMNAKNTEKSPIHENADANITCDFGDGDIGRSRSRFPHGQPHTSLAQFYLGGPETCMETLK